MEGSWALASGLWKSCIRLPWLVFSKEAAGHRLRAWDGMELAAVLEHPHVPRSRPPSQSRHIRAYPRHPRSRSAWTKSLRSRQQVEFCSPEAFGMKLSIVKHESKRPFWV